MIRLGPSLIFASTFLGLALAASAAPPHETSGISPDGLWQPVEPRAAAAAAADRPANWQGPEVFRLFTLRDDLLRQLLSRVPVARQLSEPEHAQPPAEITIPLPDGTFAKFRIERSQILAPGLAAKFPKLQTYRGQGLDEAGATVQIDIEGAELHAQVLSSSGSVLVEPYRAAARTYASFNKRRRADFKPFQCFVKGRPEPVSTPAALPLPRSGGVLRTYRLAVATTSSYASRFGGTVASVLAAITRTVTRVSGIYERELGIELQLVDNTEKLIFTNPEKDPFTNDDAAVLIQQSQATIDRILGSRNYDIGHTFSTGAGGLAALGVVCEDGQKARGVTGRSDPFGDGFDIDYVAHEIAHQFGAEHTFNGLLQSCAAPNRNAATAYEPGSGSTIEAYAGICGTDDLQENSNDYFHHASLGQILAYVASRRSCGRVTANGSGIPEVTAGERHFIPKGTPFILTAHGKDPDGHPLTYCWEESDLGPAALLSAPDDGAIPLLRSLPPSPNPARTIPRLSDLLNGVPTHGELIPQKARSMAFRVTARDNLSRGGGVSSDQTQVEIVGEAGPFRVTFPRDAAVQPGPTTVTWDSAGTEKPPIGTDFVNILLSTDGGLTFPITLALNAPNSGKAQVLLPSVSTATARIRIDSVDNIYFAISPTNFTIAAGISRPAVSSGDR